MTKNDLFIPINLQFFAEDVDNADENEGVNETDLAEQSDEENDAEQSDESVTEEAAEPQFDTDRANAAFASMRRELEAAKRQQQEIDAMYARQYGGYTNPETGRPITSARDYFEAMAAQERMQMRAQLQENNKHLLALFQHLVDQLDVDFGLAAAGDTVQQRDGELFKVLFDFFVGPCLRPRENYLAGIFGRIVR